jgi:hypothetical protein
MTDSRTAALPGDLRRAAPRSRSIPKTVPKTVMAEAKRLLERPTQKASPRETTAGIHDAAAATTIKMNTARGDSKRRT